MTTKIVAIHQPNFFPWLGFFDKMLKSDIFVLYDSCRKDSKLGWTKRVKIIKGQSTQWVGFSTCKVHKDENGLFPELFEHKIADYEKNRGRHLRKISAEYRKAPYYSSVMDYIEKIYEYKSESITEFNTHFIKDICEIFDIYVNTVKASDLEIGVTGNKANAEFTKVVGGAIYLSGDGSDGYMNEEAYSQRGILIQYQHFKGKS